MADYASIANIQYIEDQYRRFQEDPQSVDLSWRRFFEGMEFAAHLPPPAAEEGGDIRIYRLIVAYRTFGHLLARFNPIDPHPPSEAEELDLGRLGFSKEEMTKEFATMGLLPSEKAPLSEIVDALRSIYCGRTGIEYMGLDRPEMEQWIREQIESSRFRPQLSTEEKRQILDYLNQSELFEVFLQTKYTGQKRFSLEGSETLIPMLGSLIERGADVGVQEFVIGMAHRGRLNVLSNILKKSYANIFHEFEGTAEPSSFEGSGDVKYHKGFSSTLTSSGGAKVHVSLPANPSHLEAVDPVVEGQVRAKQVLKGDAVEGKRIIPILIHGDAAIAGQGVVYETFQLGKLPGYGVGGTIHIVINNQIGFTTLPKDARSTRYCTDIARTFSAPVFHVNAEDPEGCVYACTLALQIRQMYGCDVVLELNGYRKYGHNEGDEPAFTQPLEYKLIRSKRSIREIYRDELIQQGVVERAIAEQLEAEFRKELQKELDEMADLKTEAPPQEVLGEWAPFKRATVEELFKDVDTTVSVEELREVAAAFCTIPEEMVVHKKVRRLIDDRLKSVKEDEPIDWGMGEHLALGTLLWEGVHVRLAGQDSRRGTFSHRHAMWMDQEKELKYFPLSRLKEEQGRFDVFNSPLSEYAALGFEYGYSLSYPNALVMWEAQFGDFANGAQIVIDQFLCTGEEKWGRFSGLVLMLPHGYEGQGPEHSSGRMERFLQLAGNENIQVCNPTTPAQLFHLLRRQVMRKIRKPLIIFTPKALLRHRDCVSRLCDLSQGRFEEVLDDREPPKKCRQLLLCSGKIYYDLMAERRERGVSDVAILRLEQLYPLDQKGLMALVERYSGFERVLWVQEEPRNMGAWDFVRPHLRDFGLDVGYVGRARSASPAAGVHHQHVSELREIMDGVFDR